MKFIDKMQRKYGKYAITNLMQYIVAIYALGVVISLVNPYFYNTYLSLDFGKVLKGEVWRVITFIVPPKSPDIFTLLEIYIYYMIGTSLERAWGSFRFNLYFLVGILFQILASFIIYVAFKGTISNPLDYINQSMFFAFATLYPNMQMLLFFIIPIKIKYLAWIYAIVYAYNVIDVIRQGAWEIGIAMVLSIANFLIFFFATRNYKRISPKEYKRKANYKREVRKAYNPDNVIQFRGKPTVTRHKCSVCGRTELDDENLEFRFCSKCDGNYEYCMEHLYTHEHVHSEPKGE